MVVSAAVDVAAMYFHQLELLRIKESNPPTLLFGDILKAGAPVEGALPRLVRRSLYWNVIAVQLNKDHFGKVHHIEEHDCLIIMRCDEELIKRIAVIIILKLDEY